MKKVLFVLFCCISLSANAGSFGNGDFSAAGTLWNDASTTGSVLFSGNQAILETRFGTNSLSAVIVQGDDGDFNFDDPFSLANDINYLHFDAKFEVIGADSTESNSGFRDALYTVLYDSVDDNFDILSLPSIDSSKNGFGFIHYIFDISSIQGRDIALSFQLADEGDGYNSRVSLDNIRFSDSVAVVPLPSAIALFLTGLPLVGFFKRKRQA